MVLQATLIQHEVRRDSLGQTMPIQVSRVLARRPSKPFELLQVQKDEGQLIRKVKRGCRLQI